MNKRRIGLTVAVCMLVTALAAGAAIARVGSPLTGRFLLGDQDTPILIDSSGTPIILTDRTGSDLFDGLSNGDRILVFLSPVAETYPARAGAYFCLRLSSGAPEDLPRAVPADPGGAGVAHPAPPRPIQRILPSRRLRRLFFCPFPLSPAPFRAMIQK